MADLYVEEHGSTVLLVPLSAPGRRWALSALDSAPWQWHGGALILEPRNLDDVAAAARVDGMIITRSLERHPGADPRD